MRCPNWESFKAELLADPKTRAQYDRRRPAYELASHLIELRQRLDLSQRDLARASGVGERQIARIEAAHATPTWNMVARIFAAVGAELEPRFRVSGAESQRSGR